MSRLIQYILAVTAATALVPAHAADIREIRIEPATAKAGQPVKITIVGEEGASQNCGLRLEYGDGDGTDIKIVSSDGVFPRTLTKTYAKAGSYTISVKGKRVTTHFGCIGEAQAKVMVEGGVASGTKAAASCPQGWQEVKDSVKPDGSFACQIRKPAPLDCGPGLTFFEKGNTLGCRKAAKKK
jgi:hypothetical protein